MQVAYLKIVVICALLWPTFALAQEKPPAPEPAHYKLTFRLMQANSDGKITNSRIYSIIVAATAGSQRPQSIRTGDRIPAANNYIDVGTNIDTNDVRLTDQTLSLRVDVESSSALKTDTTGNGGLPLIRRTTWGSQVVVPLSKPTVIFTADNVSDTGKTELELTATEIK